MCIDGDVRTALAEQDADSTSCGLIERDEVDLPRAQQTRQPRLLRPAPRLRYDARRYQDPLATLADPIEQRHRRGLKIMAERSVPMVFLEGPPDYYSRLGFLAGTGQGFRKPSLRIPDAAFQVTLLPAYEPWMSGTLVYSEIFWQHDAVGLRDPDLLSPRADVSLGG